MTRKTLPVEGTPHRTKDEEKMAAGQKFRRVRKWRNTTLRRLMNDRWQLCHFASLVCPKMDFCSKSKRENGEDKIPNSELKECFREYKLEDEVNALKNKFFTRDNVVVLEDDSKKHERKKLDTTGVKECLQPPVPSTFQTVVHDLRDTVRSAYWNREIGKTIYLPPHLPAGCDPVETTFGKATTQDAYGVSELVNPRDARIDDMDVHKLYRRTHNDYYPSEQVDRKYMLPFDKCSSFGNAKKTADFSGKKVANCFKWLNSDPMTLVTRRLADFSNRTESRLGKVKNRDKSLEMLTFGKNTKGPVEGVADIFQETSGSRDDLYCSEYAEKISKFCGSSRATNNRSAGVPSERTDLPHVVVPDGASKSETENLGDQTSAMALVSPNIFTQLGLSHIEFFKVRESEEMRSIFENIGVEFPSNSFDIIWAEGLRKDCTGGVCVETFRNLLGKLAMHNYNNDFSKNLS